MVKQNVRELSIFQKNQFNDIYLQIENDFLISFFNKKNNPPVFNTDLINDAKNLLNSEIPERFDYLIWRSNNNKYFSMGGDIDFFKNCYISNNRKKLDQYAYDAVDVIYNNQYQKERNFETVAFVDGSAIGGGFEFALSSDCIVATNNAKFQLPEGYFGSFPGMGAYSFLCRKIGYIETRNIIKYKKTMNASDLLSMGIVECIVDDYHHMFDYLNKRRYSSLSKKRKNISNSINKVHIDELRSVVELWTQQLFSKKTLPDHMNKLIMVQNRGGFKNAS